MKLRITSGTLRGRCIEAPAGTYRPTSERARQSCINKIRPRIPDARAADLCAGSGMVGFELLSEGAREVEFVENDFVRGGEIRKHAALLGVADRTRVVEDEIERFLSRATPGYDIIFYDPPYEDDTLAALAPRVGDLLGSDGLLIYERSKRRQRPQPAPDSWDIDERDYGDTVLEYWTRR